MEEAPDDQGSREWLGVVRGLLRAEMMRRQISYADLAQKLPRYGITDNERNLRNKIARGTFSATFFIACMVAMGVETIPLDARLYPGAMPPPGEGYASAMARKLSEQTS